MKKTFKNYLTAILLEIFYLTCVAFALVALMYLYGIVKMGIVTLGILAFAVGTIGALFCRSFERWILKKTGVRLFPSKYT